MVPEIDPAERDGEHRVLKLTRELRLSRTATALVYGAIAAVVVALAALAWWCLRR